MVNFMVGAFYHIFKMEGKKKGKDQSIYTFTIVMFQ